MIYRLFWADHGVITNLPHSLILCLPLEVQQSSFYGYTGMLPKRYTQGVMTGESEYCINTVNMALNQSIRNRDLWFGRGATVAV